jgi:GNAT superfamily N-acetyltransferase
VARVHVQVRRVDETRVQDVTMLWAQLRAEAGVVAEAGSRRCDADAVLAVLSRPETVAFVGLVDGSAVGYVVVTDCALNPFADTACVSVEQLFVLKDARKSGVAKALMAAVAAYAQRHGAEQIACSVPAGVRDANRFFARLGFSPLVTRRITSTAALHRKLAGDSDLPRFALDQVLARRREARLRAAQPSH